MLGVELNVDWPMHDANFSNPGSPPPRCAPCSSWWRLPLLLSLVLAALLLARGRGGPDAAPAPDRSRAAPLAPADVAPTGETASLTIDFGHGRTLRFDALAWHDGMTVDDLLTVAAARPDGPRFGRQGSGQLAFLTAIDGVTNAGGTGRNWHFFVNGRPADRSFGAYVLRPGDQVLWKFVPAQ